MSVLEEEREAAQHQDSEGEMESEEGYERPVPLNVEHRVNDGDLEQPPDSPLHSEHSDGDKIGAEEYPRDPSSRREPTASIPGASDTREASRSPWLNGIHRSWDDASEGELDAADRRPGDVYDVQSPAGQSHRKDHSGTSSSTPESPSPTGANGEIAAGPLRGAALFQPPPPDLEPIGSPASSSDSLDVQVGSDEEDPADDNGNDSQSRPESSSYAAGTSADDQIRPGDAGNGDEPEDAGRRNTGSRHRSWLAQGSYH